MSAFSNMFEQQTATKPAVQFAQPVLVNTPTANLPVAVPRHIEQSVRQLRTVSMDNISEIGGDAGEKMGKLSDEVLQKVTLADSGELGAGIKNVLALTQSVDISKYGDNEKPGMLTKMKSMFTSSKIDFMAQFNTTSSSIEQVVTSLATGLTRMRDDASWLQKAYDANIEYHNNLELTAEAVQFYLDEQVQVLEALTKVDNPDVNEVQSKQMYVDRLAKHHDKLLRLIQLAKLTAPEIRQMQMTNYNTVETFKDLRDITIPAWKKTISLGLLAIQQKKDAEFSKGVQDAANDNLKKASDLINSNMIVATQNANRSVVDMSTLEHIQTNMIATLQNVRSIEEQGREDRKQAAIRLKAMEGELKQELLALKK